MTPEGLCTACSATQQCQEHAPADVRLHRSFDVLRWTLVSFSDRKQEFFCTVCRYRDPLGPDGNKLHDDACPLLEMAKAVEDAEREIQHLERVIRLARGEKYPPFAGTDVMDGDEDRA